VINSGTARYLSANFQEFHTLPCTSKRSTSHAARRCGRAGGICKHPGAGVSKRFAAYQRKDSAYKMPRIRRLRVCPVMPDALRMSNPELAQLDGRHNLTSLRSALDVLCSRYGVVRHLTILPAHHVGRQQALCFLRMATSEEEDRIMTALGIGRFGGELVLVVNLQPALVPDAPAAAIEPPSTLAA
jgi:hypothetical protein